MDPDKWQIGIDADVDEEEKTQLLGTYQRYKLTERPDEMLEMPEPTETFEADKLTGVAPKSPARLPVWAMVLLAGVLMLGMLAGLVIAGAVLWLLMLG